MTPVRTYKQNETLLKQCDGEWHYIVVKSSGHMMDKRECDKIECARVSNHD